MRRWAHSPSRIISAAAEAADAFENGDRQALADAGALAHALVVPRLEGNLFNELPQIIGNIYANRRSAVCPRFLLRDGHSFCERCRIVRANFRADAVFE